MNRPQEMRNSRSGCEDHGGRDPAQEVLRARSRHKKIKDWRALRQAPSLGGGPELQSVMVAWCQTQAALRRSLAWRMLGKAVLSHAMGAHLMAWTHASLGASAGRLVAEWLRWHKRHKAFGKEDLKVPKKRSKVRGLWFVVTRGARGALPSTSVNVPRPKIVTSRAALRSLQAIRTEGFTRCEVGRLPLHLEGDLPPVKVRQGSVVSFPWVPSQKGTASEWELIRLLTTDTRWNQGNRELATVDNGWAWATPALLRAGGQKIIALHRLLALKAAAGGKMVDLGRVPGNTLTTSRGLRILLLQKMGGRDTRAVVLNSQDWATLMGIPTRSDHRIRVGLRAVSDSMAKSIVGQAVHFDIAVALLSRVLDHLGLRSGSTRIRYASLLSGIDFVAAALEHLVGERLQFTLAAEANRTVARALMAAWGDRLERLTGYALSEETRSGMETLKGSLDMVMISFRCAPWSQANALPVKSTERRRQVERALEECQALLLLAEEALPRVILLECVNGASRSGLRTHWRRLQGLIMQRQQWEWSMQVNCPRESLQGFIPRKRVWFVGLR